MNLDLFEGRYEEISTWPSALKYGLLGALALFVLCVGYWHDLKKEVLLLAQAKAAQSDFEVLLSQKQKTLQNNHQEKKDLPAAPLLSEKIGLTLFVEELSHQCILMGLTVESLRLAPFKEIDFYKEHPIELTLTGTYEQLYEWLFYVATQKRLMTLEDFVIQGEEKNTLSISVCLKAYEYNMKEPSNEKKFLMNATSTTRTSKALLRDPFYPLKEKEEEVGFLISADGQKKWTLMRDRLKGVVYSVRHE